MRIGVLDCTLRDGGYLNNWKFGKGVIANIVERLGLSKVDYIELGFLKNDSYLDLDSSHITDIRNITLKPNNSLFVAMIEIGEYDISNIPQRDNNILIFGFRLMFRKKQLMEAGGIAEKLQRLGYNVFLQPVNIMDYNLQELTTLIQLTNKINPYAVYIVDTYGFMNKYDLMEKFFILDSNLNKNIKLGYHSHNNLQLAYSNCVELIEHNTQREIILDSSVFGMGKGAGNANTELILSYLNEKFEANYDIDQILEIIDIYISKEKELNPWGYSLLYYLAAITKTHHSYVRFLLNKKTLSIKSVKEILISLAEDKRMGYDEEYISQKYFQYQSKNINSEEDLKKLKKEIEGFEILLLGLGLSAQEEKSKIVKLKKQNCKFKIIAINHIPEDIKVDCVFISNAKRYGQIISPVSDIKIILTSNINPGVLKPDFVLNYSSIVDEASLSDFGGIMMLKLLVQMGVKKCFIVGFDGFKGRNLYIDKAYDFNNHDNNIESKFETSFKEIANQLNIINIAELNKDSLCL
ncbi:TPA: aldolase catalytic domain-containing protein [Campylobacter coli]|nr:aldolase catalytic domain-containing protein [Campylobacter coli]HEG0356937.1 aldolase catalytic domain-containing protein [Campylobacter coli]